jgi:hypothetical protein
MNRDEHHALTILAANPDGISTAKLRKDFSVSVKTVTKLLDAGLVYAYFSPWIHVEITSAGRRKLACDCGHPWTSHGRTANGAYACKYYGCGCRDVVRPE